MYVKKCGAYIPNPNFILLISIDSVEFMRFT